MTTMDGVAVTQQQAVTFETIGGSTFGPVSAGRRRPSAEGLGAMLNADRVTYEDLYDCGEKWSFYRGGRCVLTLRALGGKPDGAFLVVDFGEAVP